MTKYQIVFHEVQSYIVPVEADSLEEAKTKANEAFIQSVDEYFDCQVKYEMTNVVETDEDGNLVAEHAV